MSSACPKAAGRGASGGGAPRAQGNAMRSDVQNSLMFNPAGAGPAVWVGGR